MLSGVDCKLLSVFIANFINKTSCAGVYIFTKTMVFQSTLGAPIHL